MNRIYKIIWSKIRQSLVVVSECSKAQGKGTVHDDRSGRSALSCIKTGVIAAAILLASGGQAFAEAVYVHVNTGDPSQGAGNPATNEGEPGEKGGALGGQSITIGFEARAETAAINGISIGKGSTTAGDSAMAMGSAANAGGNFATALGNGAEASAEHTVAIGSGANAAGTSAFALGNDAKASKNNTVALGENAKALGVHALAIGAEAKASEVDTSEGYTIALGYRATASRESSIALGNQANASKVRAVAVGPGAQALEQYSIALGNDAQATQGSTIAIGSGSKAEGYGATALGNDAQAKNASSVALGREAKALADKAVALGNAAEVASESVSAVAIGAAARAEGENSVAVGYGVTTEGQAAIGIGVGKVGEVKGKGSLAMGSGAKTKEEYSIAIGGRAEALEGHSTAIGITAKAKKFGSTAIGRGAEASKIYSTAIGINAKASGDSSTAIGRETEASGISSTAMGYKSRAIGVGSLATGGSAETGAEKAGGIAYTAGSMALGTGTVAGKDGGTEQAVAIGYSSEATANNSLAIGFDAIAKQNNAVAIGIDSDADGDSALAMGNNAKALQDSTIVLGKNALATEQSVGGVAIGSDANSNGVSALALGNGALAVKDNTVALGNAAKADGASAVAMGSKSLAEQEYTVALGNGARATVEGAVAIGKNASAKHRNSVALGRDAATKDAKLITSAEIDGITYNNFAGADTVNGVVSVGNIDPAQKNTKQIVNVAPGAITETSTDAINGSQLFAVARDLQDASQTYFHFNKPGMAQGEGNATTNLGRVTDKAGATGENSIAAGVGAKATGGGGIAIGYAAKATGERAVVIGGAGTNTASGTNSVAMGAGTTAEGQFSTAMGSGTIAEKDYATALGGDTKALGEYSTAIGRLSEARGNQSIAMGNEAKAIGDNSLATGTQTEARGDYSTAMGAATIAKGNYSTVMGSGSKALGDYSTAMGSGSNAIGQDSLATQGGTAYTSNSIAIGEGTVAGVENGTQRSVAIGYNSQATGYESLAIGFNASVTKNNSVAVGFNASAAKNNSVALGYNANATNDNSVALGYQAETKAFTQVTNATVNGVTYGGFAGAANTENRGVVSIGKTGAEKQIVNVAPGAIDEDSTDAINGSQLFATQTVIGKMANSVTTVLGGDAALAADGAITMSNIGGTGKDTIHEAIESVNTTATAGFTISGASPTPAAVDAQIQPGETLTITGDAANTDFTRSDAGKNIYTVVGKDNTVTIGLAKNLEIESVTTGDTVLTDGSLIINSTEADAAKQISLTGNGLNNGGKQITNVASGGDIETNAANIGDINSAISDSSWQIAGNNKTAVGNGVNPGEQVNFVNGNATTVTVAADGDNFTVAYDITVDNKTVEIAGEQIRAKTTTLTPETNGEITAGNTEALATADTIAGAINQSGFTVKANSEAGGELINPGDSVDLVAGDHMGITRNGSTFTFTADTQGLVEDAQLPVVYTDSSGGKLYKQADGTFNTAADGSGTQVQPADVIASMQDGAGNTTTPVRLTNIKAGTEDADAVALSQLKGAVTALGGGAAVTAAGTVKAPTYTVTDGNPSTGGTTGYTTVGAALTGLNTAVNQPITFKADTNADTGSNGSQQQLGSEFSILSGDLTNPAFTGSNLSTEVKDGQVLIGMARSPEFSSVKLKDGANETELTTTADGLDIGGDRITNIAAGEISATSTDAVNGSQLFAATAGSREEVISSDKSVTIATTTSGAGANIYDLKVQTDAATLKFIDVDPADPSKGKQLSAVTSAITSSPAGVAAADTPGALVTAGDVASAINTSGFTAKANGDAGKLITPGDSVDFIGGDNIEITRNGGQFTVKTARDVSLDSVTTGDTVVNSDGVTISNGAAGSAVTLSKSGLDNGGNRITNVAAGEISATSTDAVNGSQLFAATAGSKEEVISSDKSVTIATTTSGAGANIYDLKVQTDAATLKFIDVDPADPSKGKQLSAVTSAITSSPAGVAAADTPGALVTAGDVASAINTSGFTAKANGDAGKLITPGDSVDFIGGDNIEITRNGGQFTVKTARDVSLDSVTTGDTVVNSDGVTISNGAAGSAVTLSKSGLDNGGNRITNVAAGDISATSTDAVNGSQLFAATAGSREEVKSTDKSVTIATTTNGAGANIYDLSVNTDGTTVAVDSTTGAVKAVTDSISVVDGKAVAATSTALATSGEIAEAINKAGFTVKANGDAGKLITPGDSVDFIGGDNIEITRNGGQFTVKTARDVSLDSVTTGDTVVNSDGVTISNGAAGSAVTLSKSGLDNGGNRITNVAAGEISATSTDAVNGSQVFALTAGSKEVVKSADQSVTVTTTQDAVTGASIYDLQIQVDSATMEFVDVDPADPAKGKKLTAVTSDITSDATGVASAVTGSSLATAGSVAAAINNAGWVGTAGAGVDGGIVQGAGDQLVKTGEKVTFDAGKNIKLVQQGQTFTYATRDDVEFTKVTTGNTVMTSSGVTAPSYTTNGNHTVTISGGSGTINGLTNTTFDAKNYTSGQAATEDQLASVSEVAHAGFNVSANGRNPSNIGPGETIDFNSGDGNIQIQNEGNTLTFNLNPDLHVNSVTTGNTQINTNGLFIKDGLSLTRDGLFVDGGPSVTRKGIDAAGKPITNVARGTHPGDAVNLSQLEEAEVRAARGTAAAMAATSMPQAYAPGSSMLTAGASTYRGESAIAVGYSTMSDNGKWILQGNASANEDDAGFSVGVGYQW